MSRTGRAWRGAAAVRLLAVLTVLLGLLGMHGLASTHHAAAVARAHSSAVPPQPVAPEPQAQPSRHGSATAAGPGTITHLLGDAAVRPAVPVCDDDCPNGLALLCAAVLAAAAATAWLLTATAGRRVPVASARRGARARAPAGARLLPLGPDPVAELCVSRT